MCQEPAELAAEEVHGFLRQVVGMVLNDTDSVTTVLSGNEFCWEIKYLKSSERQEPAELAAEEVHGILRQVVGMVLSSSACEALQRFPALQREIAGTAAAALATMRGA